MNYVILDLEWNGTFSKKKKKYINEIIEFGAVKTDERLNIIDTFSYVVRPQIGKQLTNKIKQLTNISETELKNGKPFQHVMSKFKKFLSNSILLTWSTSDMLTLMENQEYYMGNYKINFIKKYIDLQEFCQFRLELSVENQISLLNVANMLNINYGDLKHHRALNDCFLELKCFKKLYNKDELQKFIKDTSKDNFFDRLKFKTITLCNLKNPLIRPSSLNFKCNVCGKKATKISTWELKNKAFKAIFYCKHCRNQFIGEIRLKLKYDSLCIKKKYLSKL